jgi:hypothetical protein
VIHGAAEHKTANSKTYKLLEKAYKMINANAAVNSNANIVLTHFAHFYNEGERGMAGNAPQNDKVWGVAKINGTLVNFWGRRNGVLKFKTFLKGQEYKVLSKYAEKIGDRTDGGDIYTPVRGAEMVNMLSPKLISDISKHYYTAMSNGKLNTRH